jgi:hypothetical protein
MKATQVPFENAIDLLDADHKGVKQMFIEYGALVEDEAPPRPAARWPSASARS